MTKIPPYEQNNFWEPQSEAEAIELALSHQDAGLDPSDYAGAYGSYASFATCDLPWDTTPFEPVADLSGAQGGESADLALQVGGVVSWSAGGVTSYGLVQEINSTDLQAAELADSDLIRLWETRNSGEEFARTWRELESRGCAIELSEEPTTDLSDEELWQAGREILDGTAARRRAERRVLQAAEERADYWRRAHERGEVLPRDLEGLI